MSRINFCCNQVRGDHELIRSLDPEISIKHRYFSYNGVQKNKLESYSNEFRHHHDPVKILLGNSANASNNHIDALKMLYNYEDKIKQITCPLSYSGSQAYINKVINVGKELFGDRFVPVQKFLPLEEYKKVLNSVDIGVFYHSRQQAYSNTIMLLEQKKQILMNPKLASYNMYQEFEVENVYNDFSKLLQTEVKDIHNLYINLGENKIDSWYENVLNKSVFKESI